MAAPLWERVLAALGINVTQLKWRWRRWQANRQRRSNEGENQRRALKYQHKVCGGCGLTVDKNERICPRCKERLPSAAAERFQRYLRLVVPEGAYSYTMVLTAINVALYLVMVMQSPKGGLFSGPDPRTAVRFGAWFIPLMVADDQWWRLITPIFIHLGGLHILFNSVALVQLGPLVEQSFGRSRFLVMYLGAGVGGFALSIGSRIFSGDYGGIGAGASGSLFGMIAAALVLGYLRKSAAVAPFREGIFRWALLGVAISLAPGIDLLAHLGGALCGGALAAFLPLEGQARANLRRLRIVWVVAELLCVYLICHAFALAILSVPKG
jgi:membrane associated rhomboid family serine protease